MPAHGDLDADQLVVTPAGELVVLDFDDVCMAAPALDLAAYLADVVRGDGGDLAAIDAVERPLLDGYGGRPPALGWYLAAVVLARAPHPFQRADPAWPERVKGTGEDGGRGARPVTVPRDPALPQLGILLDPDLLAPVLTRSLGRPARLDGPWITRVSYKPGERVTVHYRVSVDGCGEDAVARAVAGRNLEARARQPYVRELARRVAGRVPAAQAITYWPDADAVLTWLPLDPGLPALAESPRRLAVRLRKRDCTCRQALRSRDCCRTSRGDARCCVWTATC